VWKEEFTLTKIRATSCDVCGESYIYKNAFDCKDELLPEALLDIDEGNNEEALNEVDQEKEQARLFMEDGITVM
jgi:hypothetical protein